MKKLTPLTDRQRKFCDLILTGISGVDAYIEAGYKVKNRTVAKAAAPRLLRLPQVEAYLTEQREATDALNALSRGELVETLTKIVRERGSDIHPAQAAQMLTRILGWSAPSQVEVKQENVPSLAEWVEARQKGKIIDMPESTPPAKNELLEWIRAGGDK